MRALFLSILLFFTIHGVHAQNANELKFNYHRKFLANETFEKNLLLGTISKSLEAKLIGQLGLGKNFLVDEIFSSLDLKKTVLLKMGYSIDDESILDQITPVRNGLLYHSTTKSGLPFALMFTGFNLTEVHETLNQLRYTNYSIPEKTKSLFSISSSLFISQATAQDNCDEQSSFFQSVVAQFNSNSGLRCLTGVMKGAWDSTGGLVTGVAHGAWQVVTNPVQAAKAVWSGAEKFWNGILAFYNDALGVMQKTYAKFDQLSPQQKSEIICRVASAVGTGVLIGFITAGSAGPAILTRIAKILENIESVLFLERPILSAGVFITAVKYELLQEKVKTYFASSSALRKIKAENPATFDASLLKFDEEAKNLDRQFKEISAIRYGSNLSIKEARSRTKAFSQSLNALENHLALVKKSLGKAAFSTENSRLITSMENMASALRSSVMRTNENLWKYGGHAQ